MTSDLLIAKSNKPFSDLILFDHTIAFHAVYLSLVPGAHMWLFLPLRMPASPAPPQPYPCASLRKAHLLHASDSHFTEPCSSSLFLSISMIASSNSLLKAISLPYFPSPFFFFLSPFLEEFQYYRYGTYLYFANYWETPHYIPKHFPTLINKTLILNGIPISPRTFIYNHFSKIKFQSSLFDGSCFLPRVLLL